MVVWVDVLVGLIGGEPQRVYRVVRLIALAVLLGVVLTLVPSWWQQVVPAPGWHVPAERVAAARAVLPDLAIVPEPAGGYDRSHFGTAWYDVDGNGCDTRNDQLAHWLIEVGFDAVNSCVVDSGVLHDPYTGHRIEFQRGPGTSAAVQIDHVVALGDAWGKGAHAWGPELALQFANDPANLIPVDGPTNQDKGSADAAHWLPPDSRFHCAYAVQQTLIKDGYGLGVSPEELAALTDLLDACP